MKKLLILSFFLFLTVGIKGCSDSVSMGFPLFFLERDYTLPLWDSFSFSAFEFFFNLLFFGGLISIFFFFRKKWKKFLESRFLFWFSVSIILDFFMRGIPTFFLEGISFDIFSPPFLLFFGLIYICDNVSDVICLPIGRLLDTTSYQIIYLLFSLLAALILVYGEKGILKIWQKGKKRNQGGQKDKN